MEKEKVVQVIPARKADDDVEQKEKLRVAAYCRVSTEQEKQLGSFENQVEYYTRLIEEKADWKLAGIFADEGISGTGTRKRKGFQRLMDDCEAGKIGTAVRSTVLLYGSVLYDFVSTGDKIYIDIRDKVLYYQQ